MTDGPVGGRQCTATSKRSGQRCRRAPIIGGTTCWVHGGAAPQTQAAAGRRVAEAQAMAVYERWSPNGHGPGPVDVLGELAAVVAEIGRFKDFFGERLAALTADQWRFDHPDRARVRAETEIYERALDRTSRVLVDVARLDLDGRRVQIEAARVRLEQAKGKLVFRAFQDGLGELELTEHQWALARVAMPKVLRALTAADG